MKKGLTLCRLILPLLFVCALTVPGHCQKTGFDIHVLYELRKTRTPFQTAFFKTISDINNPVCLAVPAALFIYGWIKRNKNSKFDALQVVQSIAVSEALSFLIKAMVGRLRPQYFDTNFVPLVVALNKSFPSGHTTEAFCIATSVALLGMRWYFVVPAFCWAVMIAYARMYLGVHFPTDVMGGIVLGSGVAWGIWALSKKGRTRRIPDDQPPVTV